MNLPLFFDFLYNIWYNIYIEKIEKEKNFYEL